MNLILKTFIIISLLVDKLICDAFDSDAIMFPDDSDEKINVHSRSQFPTRPTTLRDNKILNSSRKSSAQQIPLDFIKKLNEIDNVTLLLENYLEGEEKVLVDLGISSRFGNMERVAAAKLPKAATCKPTLQTVELKVSDDPSIFIYPQCTRVERCGGCCSHSLLSCQPVETETLSYQVLVSQYNGGSKLNVKEKEIVFVDKHIKCRCDCIIKKENCNSFQEYKKDECKCICTNLDEKKKCEKYNNTKLWDPNECKCKCREITDCTTGFYYDQNKCECTSIPVRRRFADLFSSQERNFNDREKYDVIAGDVAPLKENIDDNK